MEMGANPSMGGPTSSDLPGGQVAAGQPPAQQPAQQQTAVATASTYGVEGNPTVIEARRNLATAVAERDRIIGEKEQELAKARADHEKKVNDATIVLNKAIEEATKTPAKG